MRYFSLLGFTIPAILLSVAPLAGQCQMVYNVSVYNDGSVSQDLSTVYGYSNAADNSTLCSCAHSNYQTTATVYAPDGSSGTSQQGGLRVECE